MTSPSSVDSSLRSVLFLPIRWKSKKRFEHVSPYLNQVAALSWWFRTTCSCRESVRRPCAIERMSRTGSSSGLLFNWISARRILCCSFLIRTPFAHLFSLANLPLQMSTLLVAASNQLGQSASRLGGGWVPLQASRRAALLLSSLNRVVSKYVAAVGGEEERPEGSDRKFSSWMGQLPFFLPCQPVPVRQGTCRSWRQPTPGLSSRC